MADPCPYVRPLTESLEREDPGNIVSVDPGMEDVVESAQVRATPPARRRLLTGREQRVGTPSLPSLAPSVIRIFMFMRTSSTTEMNGRGRAAHQASTSPERGPGRLGDLCGDLATASVAKTQIVVAVLPWGGNMPRCRTGGRRRRDDRARVRLFSRAVPTGSWTS